MIGTTPRGRISIRVPARVPGSVAGVLLLALLALPSPTAPQAVQGRLMDRDTRTPVEGALVLLLDARGQREDGSLTGPDGRFELEARSPGSYSLHAYRLGYRTVTLEAMRLLSGETMELELEAAMDPILLEGLRVEAGARCVVRPGEGEELARLWEEVMKALTVQAWAAGEELFRFRMLEFERELDPAGRVVLSGTGRVVDRVTSTPVRSLPPEELIERGFIRMAAGESYEYFGPDASALLSDPFLDTHCFRLRLHPESPGLVGLGFEPVREEGPPDIRGTLWLERRSARLRTLEFEYDRTLWKGAEGVGRGRVEFQELPNGAWVIPWWWIRIPSMAQERQRLLLEVGGEMIRITSLEDAEVLAMGTGTVRGLVARTSGADPVPGVGIWLPDGRSTSTDAAGRFLLEEVPAGGVRLALGHPLLDSLGVAIRAAELHVREGRAMEARLELPDRDELLSAVCGGPVDGSRHAVITGVVREPSTGAEAPGVRVLVEAYERFFIFGRRVAIETVTGPTGRFFACGVPTRARIKIGAGSWAAPGPLVELEIHPGQLVRQDLVAGHRSDGRNR